MLAGKGPGVVVVGIAQRLIRYSLRPLEEIRTTETVLFIRLYLCDLQVFYIIKYLTVFFSA